MTLLFMLGLAAIANELGIDVLLGAFAAGVVVRIAAAKHDDEEDDADASSIFGFKLEGIGFGMLVPIFFVVSGTRIDLKALFSQPASALVVPGFLLLMIVVRAIPTFLVYRKGLERRQRRAMAVMSATGLPLIVVITTIAVENGYISSADAAAMVAAGMLSVDHPAGGLDRPAGPRARGPADRARRRSLGARPRHAVTTAAGSRPGRASRVAPTRHPRRAPWHRRAARRRPRPPAR